MSDFVQEATAKIVESANHLIAVKFFKARTRSGIYRSELADLLEIDEVELARYENGLDPIPASTLVLAASFMGIELEYFYEDADSAASSAKIVEEFAQPALV